MSGIDSAKAAAKEREYFRDAVRKNNQATEKRIENENIRNKEALNKQREIYIKDKNDLEKTYQENLEDIKTKTKEMVGNRSKKANENLERQIENFNRESQVKSKDFEQRLNDIKNSYGKAFDSERELYTQLKDADQKRYGKNIKDIQHKTDDVLRRNQEKMSDSVADLKDDFMRDTQKMARNQENQLKDISKSEFQKQSQLKDQLTTNLESTKRSHDAELASKQDYIDTRTSELQNNFQTHSTEMAQDFSDRMNNFAQSQRNQNLKSNRENQKLLNDLNVNHSKELRNQQAKYLKESSSGDVAKISEEQGKINSMSMYNNRVKHLQNQLIESDRKSNAELQKEQDIFAKTFKDERQGNAQLTEKKLNEAKADKTITMAQERVKNEKKTSNLEFQNRIDRENFNREIKFEKDAAKTRMKNMDENFKKTLSALEQKSRMDLDDLKNITQKDKDDFMRIMTENRNNEMYEMKREFGRVMDMTVEGYEKRLSTYQRENEYLKQTMDQKVQNMMDQANKSIETQKKLFDDITTANEREMQILNDQREHNHRTEMNKMMTSFQKKMDKMQLDNETKVKILTNDYENKLKELSSLRNKDNMMNEMSRAQELERIKDTFDKEKERIITQYQNQIIEMKKSHDSQVEDIKNFKKLS